MMKYFFGLVVIVLMIIISFFAVSILFKGLPPELSTSRFLPLATTNNPECDEMIFEKINATKSANGTRVFNQKFSLELPKELKNQKKVSDSVVFLNEKKQSLVVLGQSEIKPTCYEEAKADLGNTNNISAIENYFEEKGNTYLGYDIEKINVRDKISYEKNGVYFRGNSIEITVNNSTETIYLNSIFALSKNAFYGFTELANSPDVTLKETNDLFTGILIR